jgi:hypothetical protein
MSTVIKLTRTANGVFDGTNEYPGIMSALREIDRKDPGALVELPSGNWVECEAL